MNEFFKSMFVAMCTAQFWAWVLGHEKVDQAPVRFIALGVATMFFMDLTFKIVKDIRRKRERTEGGQPGPDA